MLKHRLCNFKSMISSILNKEKQLNKTLLTSTTKGTCVLFAQHDIGQFNFCSIL